MTDSFSHQTNPDEGAPAEQTSAELTELSAEFELQGELGRGGTAVVYRARDRALDRLVAIKVIRARYVDDDELIARLEREARLVARLDHPNVVSLLGVRRLGGGSLALIMRYVQGHTLREELLKRGALPVERALVVLDDIGRALSSAHAHGIVHRDVKPENIHVEHGAQRALLADFGSATPMRDDLRLTVAGMTIGTPGYMAPELIDGAPATPASDVYSLGLVAWEMLAGRAPWQGDSLFAVLSFRKQGTLPELHTIRPDVPRAVSDAIAGALRADPTERWPDMYHFGQALTRPTGRRWLAGKPVRRAPPTRTQHPVTLEGETAPPVAAQPTVRIERPTIADSRAPSSGHVGNRAMPPMPDRGSDAEGAHPADAIFAADDSDDVELMSGTRYPRARRRVPVGLLTLAAIALLLFAGTALLRYLGQDTNRLATLGTDSDAPRSIAVQSPSVAAGPTAMDSAAASEDATWILDADSASASFDGVMERAGDVAPMGTASGSSARRPEPPPTSGRATSAPPTRTGQASPAAPDIRANTSASSGISSTATIANPPPPPATLPASPSQVEAPAPSPAASSPSSAATSVARIALGGMHSCVTYADGHLACWGADGSGQTNGPTGNTRFTTISSGLTHSCGIAADGQAMCWGANDHGQLGNGSRAARSRAVPVRDGQEFTALALGEASTCALTRSGRTTCWGANDAGQLGTGDNEEHTTPVTIATTARFTTLVAGWRHFCALTTDLRAYCWGDNQDGQLGDGTTTSRDRPTSVSSSLRFLALAAGRAQSCGLTTSGTVYCWGRNDAGQLGTSARADATTPRPVNLPGAAKDIAAGSAHGCALLTDGSPYCWGQNRYGQLGDGSYVDRDTPVRVTGVPALADMDASGAHSCGRDSRGELYCWGYNVFGQLGDGSRRNSPVPIAIPPRK